MFLTFQAQADIIGNCRRDVAKLGIALGSGPRGPGFESRRSDQSTEATVCCLSAFLLRCTLTTKYFSRLIWGALSKKVDTPAFLSNVKYFRLTFRFGRIGSFASLSTCNGNPLYTTNIAFHPISPLLFVIFVTIIAFFAIFRYNIFILFKRSLYHN